VSKRILVVDDDVDTTAMLAMYLQSLGARGSLRRRWRGSRNIA
jgi:CheY-like chemotaxis protein